MNNRILNSFRDIFNDQNNTASYTNYYIALCNWIIDNKEVISDELLERNRLVVLLNMDINKHIVDNPELQLENEKNRIGHVDFSSLDGLLGCIADTMWDMVTIHSMKTCSNCSGRDLRYIKINYHKTNGKIVLECCDCGCMMNTDGSMIVEKIIEYLPATKAEIDASMS